MVMCEYCFIWYHESCLSDYRKEEYDGDKKYKCEKCSYWEKHLQEPLLDIILKRKTYNELVNADKTGWTFESILMSKKKDFLNTENKIFDQILYAKAWFYLSEYLLNNVAS